jgi:RNA-directed DNA polymerase
VSTSLTEAKSFEISKREVWRAYERVKANKGAPGVDGVAIEEFETDLRGNLYRVWNRMSSGSYFPPPVRAVPIPKPGGGVRVLGVPTVADRIAQTVVAARLEARVEPMFHPDSYGYRPGRSALDAVAVTRRRCWSKDWVLDLDIRAFFDSVDHDLLIKAVEANTEDRWVLLYVRRWLAAPMAHPDGMVQDRDCGTPQGSAVSPVLANLFLRYAFDAWMAREFPAVRFERYVDDVVVHATTFGQAERLRSAIAARMVEVGLELHPDKTKIVYCKDDNRRGHHEHTSFTFLGYTFRTRSARNKHGRMFASFSPAVSRQPGRRGGDGPTGPQVAHPPANGWKPRGPRPVDESHRAGLDAVLRGVQPHRAVSPAAPHQHLPGAVGPQEVSSVARVQEGQGLVAGALRPLSPRVRPVGLDPGLPPDRMVRAV